MFVNKSWNKMCENTKINFINTSFKGENFRKTCKIYIVCFLSYCEKWRVIRIYIFQKAFPDMGIAFVLDRFSRLL